jgi:putative transposase
MSRIERRVHRAGVYFVTTDTWQRRPIFKKENVAETVLEQILECRARSFYKLHAFVIMPDHLHLLLTPGIETSLEKAMQIIKGGSAYRIKKGLSYQFPIWHSGFHDRWMRDEAEYQSRLKYILENPVAARLVSDSIEYPWSSSTGKWEMDAAEFDEWAVRG